jgi:hypothetical protein
LLFRLKFRENKGKIMENERTLRSSAVLTAIAEVTAYRAGYPRAATATQGSVKENIILKTVHFFRSVLNN